MPENTPEGCPNSKTYTKYAVASNNKACSDVGADILSRGGSVVDAAISVCLCTALHHSQSAGIGGGFVMTLYDSSNKKVSNLNAREVAPLSAHPDMYNNLDRSSSASGGIWTAVPTEIAGFWAAHQRFGKLTWEELFQPAIEMAEKGVPISKGSAAWFKDDKIGLSVDFGKHLTSDSSLGRIFTHSDGRLKQEGELIQFPKLAETYRRISKGGATEFYQGSLADDIINDIQEEMGVITVEDFKLVKPVWKEPLKSNLESVTVFTPHVPAAGATLSLILNILKEFRFNPASIDDKEKVLTYHRTVEALRLAFAKHSSLGDDRNSAALSKVIESMPNLASDLRAKITDDGTHDTTYYKPEYRLSDDFGTDHVSILGPNGDALSITSTINLPWGGKVCGTRTGIIFNNTMNDFSTTSILKSQFFWLRNEDEQLLKLDEINLPPNPFNQITPGLSPQSSICPLIAIDNAKGKVKMVAGATGGSNIISRLALLIASTLWFGKSIEESVNSATLHSQLIPNLVKFKKGFDQDVINGLVEKGHQVLVDGDNESSVQAIYVRDDGLIDAACCPCKGGEPGGV